MIMSLNRNYEKERLAISRAFVRGTDEYKKRLSYPGLIPRCDDAECVNRKAELFTIGPTTYALCKLCSELAPCETKFYKAAACKTITPKKKRRQAAITAFAAYCLSREREARALSS